MKVYTCFLLFGAFAYSHSSPVTKPTEDKRAPNTTLKRIPEINDKETSKNDNIATNKIVVGVTNISQPHSTVETFTDFMQELVIILNTYNDVIFKDFVDIVDKDIKKNFQGNQNELQNLFVKESNFLMKKSVAEKKAAISQIVDMMKLLKIFDTNVRELLDYINSLYRKEATIKFQKILRDLRGYSTGYGNSRTKDGFAKLVRECVKATAFIHGNLNTDVERTLKKYTDTILKKYKQFYSFTSASSTTNSVIFKPIISQTKSNTNTAKISDYNISTVNKTPKTSLKLNPTKTTAHIKDENKIIRVFRTDTNENNQEDATIRHETSFKLNLTNITTHTKEENKRIRTESNQEDATATHETSKRGESNSQQKNTTHTSANDNATEELFYMTTEKPEIVYKSESKSKLVEKMLGENSTEKQVTGQSITTPQKRSSIKNELGKSKEVPKKLLARHSLKQYTTTKDLRRSGTPPLAGEVPSIEIFDRDRRRRRKKTHKRTTKATTELPELKDYLKRMRQLQRNLQELKLINELNHLENNSIDEHETKDKKPRNKRKESKKLKKSKSEVQREQTKVDDTEKDVKPTNSVNKDREVLGRDVEIKDDTHHLSHKMRHKNKDRRNKSKKTIKATRYKDIESNGIDEHEPKYKKPSNKRKESKKLKKRKYSYEHKKKDTRSKSKKTTKEAETFTEPNKHKSKKLAFKSSEALPTTKNNPVNKKHAKTRFKTSKVIDSEEDLTNSVSEDREAFERIVEIKAMIHKKKNTRSKSKKTTEAAETSTKPKYRSKKKLVFGSSESVSTAKDKAVNKKHAKSRLKISKKVSEKITQSSINETGTKGIIQITDYDKNKTTTAYSLRRLLEAFPSLFEKHTLEGLYPAHLWN